MLRIVFMLVGMGTITEEHKKKRRGRRGENTVVVEVENSKKNLAGLAIRLIMCPAYLPELLRPELRSLITIDTYFTYQ